MEERGRFNQVQTFFLEYAWQDLGGSFLVGLGSFFVFLIVGIGKGDFEELDAGLNDIIFMSRRSGVH